MFNRRDRAHPADPEARPAEPALDTGDLKEAYRMGRKDERARRKRHPVLMTFTFLAALVGVALLSLAAINGSFERAGQVADHNLDIAADRAEPVVRDAAGEAGEAIRGVGDPAPQSAPAPADRPS